MTHVLGLDGYMFRNSATHATPTWVEMTNVKNVTVPLEKAEADVTTRAAEGWRQLVGTLKTASIDFQMVYDQEDADFGVIQAAFFANSIIEFWIADGPAVPASGETSQGFRAGCEIFAFGQDQNLEEAFMVNVTIKPGRFWESSAVVAPDWYSVTTP